MYDGPIRVAIKNHKDAAEIMEYGQFKDALAAITDALKAPC